MTDWNAKIIEEFRANDGHVGGNFDGAHIALVHSVGRRSGVQRLNPLAYLPDGQDADSLYIFASAAGRPKHPDWYYNLKAAGETEVEVGPERYPVTVSEMTGEQRDRIYAEQVRRMPGFGDYERSTEGIRTIPVLRLTRKR
jgi:deazaflavin-dependent oxidoreductase (nitroreductase family)